jgi:hypothetical protein
MVPQLKIVLLGAKLETFKSRYILRSEIMYRPSSAGDDACTATAGADACAGGNIGGAAGGVPSGKTSTTGGSNVDESDVGLARQIAQLRIAAADFEGVKDVSGATKLSEEVNRLETELRRRKVRAAARQTLKGAMAAVVGAKIEQQQQALAKAQERMVRYATASNEYRRAAVEVAALHNELQRCQNFGAADGGD